MFNKNFRKKRKEKMKKLFALILALVMALSLVACGEKAPAADDGAATPDAGVSTDITEELKATALYTKMTTAATEYDEIISTGPNGETAVHADTLALTEAEINQIRAGGYKAAICMHYGGNDWSTSQVAGLKDAF